MHDAHGSAELKALHDAVLDIVAVINRPERDALLIAEAGVRLERALFPLLVLAERFGPIGVVDLAGRVGRDHSVVSRQVAKLVALGHLERRVNPTDRRSREIVATAEGRALARRIDEARDRLARQALREWSPLQVEVLATSLRRYADALAGQAVIGEEPGAEGADDPPRRTRTRRGPANGPDRISTGVQHRRSAST